MIGRVIGTYKIQSKIGEGGMGAVYKGVDTMLDREVAIKALKPELASQTAIVDRFRSEAVTLAKLNHPNIATLYSLLREGDELYMVLEYVRGQSLDEILMRRGALPADEVIPVFCQILDGINHAHEYGIIHRDIKPANMMLTENGNLKVLDFGIARLLGSNRMTRAGNIIGTLEYMAPEQVRGLETDARSDTYSLGMMLYEVLTGRTPFDTDNEFELMKLQTESMPPSPRSINPTISEEVEAAIFRAIQKDPVHRFQTAGDFREALLDAGFAEKGALRRITGPGRAMPATLPPSAPSQPESPAPTAVSADAAKETRLGSMPPVAAADASLKETRLGSFQPAGVAIADQSNGSFFDRLTWVHYMVGGVAAAFILGLVLVVPIVIFSGALSSGNSNTVTPSNSGSNSNSAQAKQPEAKTPDPTPLQTPAVAAVSSPEPKQMTEPTPAFVAPPAEREKPVDRPSAPPSRARQEPPPPPTQPKKLAPAPKKAPSRDQELRRARCALTGDC